MKNNSRWRQTEEQGYYISISDLMSGLLFIFIITLVVFAMNLKQEVHHQQTETTRLSTLVHSLTNNEETRTKILKDIQSKLQQRGFRVQIDLEHGILRLPEEILFPSGSATLQPRGIQMIDALAQILAETLPDYVIVNSRQKTNNNTIEDKSKIDAILIEGHTDNRPVSDRCNYDNNWDLSTARSIATYDLLMKKADELKLFINKQGQPIFSVSGYADSRPIAPNDTEINMLHNRRIDLRFIMTPPSATPEVLRVIEEKFK